jgi:rhodanese-related sulfurtransferase
MGDNMFQTEDKVKHIYAEDLLNDPNIPLDHIIDIREPLELEAMSLDGVLHIPMRSLLLYPEKYLSIHTRYYLLCRSGRRSYDLAELLLKKGYDVVNIVGGILTIEELKARES